MSDNVIGKINQYLFSKDATTIKVDIQTLKEHRSYLIDGYLQDALRTYVSHHAYLAHLTSNAPSDPSAEYEEEVAELRKLVSEALDVVHEDIALVETSDVFVYDGSGPLPENDDQRQRLTDPASVRAWYAKYLVLLDAKATRVAEAVRSDHDIAGIAATLKNHQPLSSAQRKGWMKLGQVELCRIVYY
ncbi:hypothetical protein BJ742DRAFT_296508 [Cladochytrium replicatum]|nr:hypothetical protein BJ742DRAFT_296508 [Cladochytrium replicatum]